MPSPKLKLNGLQKGEWELGWWWQSGRGSRGMLRGNINDFVAVAVAVVITSPKWVICVSSNSE